MFRDQIIPVVALHPPPVSPSACCRSDVNGVLLALRVVHSSVVVADRRACSGYALHVGVYLVRVV